MFAVCGTRAPEYKRGLAVSLGEPNDSDDSEKVWIHLKTKSLRCLRAVCDIHPECPKVFLTKETLNTIEETPRARFEGKPGQ